MVQKSREPPAVLWNLMKNLVFSVSTGARPPEPSTKGEPVHVLRHATGVRSRGPSNVFFSQREINMKSTKLITYICIVRSFQ